MAIAVRPSPSHGINADATAAPARTKDPLRTECLTSLAVTLGIVMWGVIILIVRALM